MSDHLVAEADYLVERTKHRIDQYRRHIESMEHEGRESEGATLVLKRLQRVAVRLQIYRDMLEDGEDRRRFVKRRGNAGVTGARPQAPVPAALEKLLRA